MLLAASSCSWKLGRGASAGCLALSFFAFLPLPAGARGSLSTKASAGSKLLGSKSAPPTACTKPGEHLKHKKLAQNRRAVRMSIKMNTGLLYRRNSQRMTPLPTISVVFL